MRFINLSLEDLEKESRDWAKRIVQEYKPDLIVFVAKAGFIIGKVFSDEMQVSMCGVETIRESGNGIKNLIAPIIRVLPNFVRNFLIMIELSSGIHSKKGKRDVRLLEETLTTKGIQPNRILIVDDSIDTGASIKAVKEFLKSIYPNAVFKIAGLNVWDKSKKEIETDFALYKNTVIKAPMSKDSKEYDKFICLYETYLKIRK